MLPFEGLKKSTAKAWSGKATTKRKAVYGHVHDHVNDHGYVHGKNNFEAPAIPAQGGDFFQKNRKLSPLP